MVPSIELNITQREALALSHQETENFVADQLDRFEQIYSEEDPTSAAYSGGRLCWCATAADALLLLSVERSTGHRAMLLVDLGSDRSDERYVVLTSRKFNELQPA